MEADKKIQVLRRQVEEANAGVPADFGKWRERTAAALRVALGKDHPVAIQFTDIRYGLSMWTSSTPDSAWAEAQADGVREAIALLEAAIYEIELDGGSTTESPSSAVKGPVGDAVFVVHGHADGTKQTVARAILQLTGREPTILHEQADGGRTIIEKLEDHAQTVGFAVVLLTPDDVGGPASTDQLNPRARQNVVLEAGYFIGLLGRSRVVLLHEEGVELPSDLQGVLYIALDGAHSWRYTLGRELQHAGIDADLNRLT